jgi:glycosyltransferase involved in cell wall biosynthesis
LSESIKATAAIKLVDNIVHEELQNWYNSADFIISGSHYEGSGIAVCEGMSCGCIPIVTSIPSFTKMTGPGKCGILYTAGNETALLNALLKTKTLDIAAEKNKVLQQFYEQLSFSAIAKKLSNIIRSL